ncbi:hypothetical protein OYC64_010351 [Pagothenia borchgrevinki]|uniref:Uncharacterized protein n=1 Tax=Pagothenia borchgrevinki TaxID=8213 RepID=A0ABD2GWU4_PAGBO
MTLNCAAASQREEETPSERLLLHMGPLISLNQSESSEDQRTEGSDFVEMKLREDTTEWTDMSRRQGPNMLT